MLIRLIIMGRNQELLRITDEQRNELNKWAASRTLRAGDVFRARLILALADGATYEQIMTSLQTSAPTISRWKRRFEQDGIDGLDPRHKGSQPRVADAALHKASETCRSRFEKTFLQTMASWLVDADKRLRAMP